MDMLHMTELKPAFDTLAQGELILDVRTPEEFDEGRVPGSKNIPYDALEPHIDELKQYSKIYVYCRAGRRSVVACQTLSFAGIENLVCVVQSGMPEWEDAHFPIER